MKITPRDKKAASIVILLGGVFIILAGSIPLCTPFLRGDYWLIIFCGPFAFLTWWIGRTLLSTYLNSAFSTTEVDLEGDRLAVRNRPFGRSFDLAYSDIRTCMITNIVNPKACLEILLTDRAHKTYSVCSFREASAPIEALYNTIKTKAEQAGSWGTDTLLKSLGYEVRLIAPGQGLTAAQMASFEALAERMPDIVAAADLQPIPKDDGWGNAAPPFDINTAHIRSIGLSTDGIYYVVFENGSDGYYQLKPRFIISPNLNLISAEWCC